MYRSMDRTEQAWPTHNLLFPITQARFSYPDFKLSAQLVRTTYRMRGLQPNRYPPTGATSWAPSWAQIYYVLPSRSIPGGREPKRFGATSRRSRTRASRSASTASHRALRAGFGYVRADDYIVDVYGVYYATSTTNALGYT